MALLRIFLAWMLLAALPLQGFAAATMLYCGPVGSPQHRPAAVAGATQDHHRHHHAGAGEKHEHASLDKAAGETSASAASDALPDTSHKCGVCASCCSSIALAETPFLLAASPAPQVLREQAFLPVHSRPAPVLDKPPRG